MIQKYQEEKAMLYFDSDYMEGAHPAILQRLMETNMEHTYGYGKDAYCESAKAKIRTACQCPEAEIYFLVGGTRIPDISVSTRLVQLKAAAIRC